MYFTLNGDGTAANYVQHRLWGSGTAVNADGTTSQNICAVIPEGNFTSINAGWIIDILDYANTSKNKTMRAAGGYDTNGGGFVGLISNLWTSTAAINSISFTQGGASFKAGSVFALYGIKG
jgi:hypothetical protein